MTAVKDFFVGKIGEAKALYRRDLEAMSEEQLGSGAGQARSPYDFTYEVYFVNQRIVKRLNGEDPGSFPEGWVKAPDEFKHKAKAIAELDESFDHVIAALEKLSDEDLSKKITLPNGETSGLEMAYMASMHGMYHCAQLNYIQAINGDHEMHWA